MKSEIKYIELKTGYEDDGPAWIGIVEFSKTGKTMYFNGKSFKGNGHGICSDVETKEVYWISGIKKNGEDRHWAGKGKIMIDKNVVEEYLELVDFDNLNPSKFEVVDIKPTYKEKFKEIENAKLYESNDKNIYESLSELSKAELEELIEKLKNKEERTNFNNGLKYIIAKRIEAEKLLSKFNEQ